MEAKTTNEQTSHPDKRLQSLCNYYLNCISLENSNNISLTSKVAFSKNTASSSYPESTLLVLKKTFPC